MPRRWCLDCTQLIDAPATRCPPHQAAADQRATARRARAAAGRPSATRRGYGVVYQRRARAVVARARAAGQPCGICLEPCLPGQQLVAHHPDGNPAAADPATCRLVPAHAGCNAGHRP